MKANIIEGDAVERNHIELPRELETFREQRNGIRERGRAVGSCR